MTKCAKNVSNDVVDNNKVEMSGGLHELADNIDNIRDVKSSDV